MQIKRRKQKLELLCLVNLCHSLWRQMKNKPRSCWETTFVLSKESLGWGRKHCWGQDVLYNISIKWQFSDNFINIWAVLFSSNRKYFGQGQYFSLFSGNWGCKQIPCKGILHQSNKTLAVQVTTFCLKCGHFSKTTSALWVPKSREVFCSLSAIWEPWV